MRRPKVLLGLLLVLCLATRIGFIVAVPWCAEDAYITFRYAQNWAHGFGPIYNLGEKEWGFTSALWTSFLALTSWARLPIEATSRATLVACDLATLGLAWRLLMPNSLLAAFGFGLFFALWPPLAKMPATRRGRSGHTLGRRGAHQGRRMVRARGRAHPARLPRDSAELAGRRSGVGGGRGAISFPGAARQHLGRLPDCAAPRRRADERRGPVADPTPASVTSRAAAAHCRATASLSSVGP